MMFFVGMENYASAQSQHIFKDCVLLVISFFGFWKKKVVSLISLIVTGLLLFLIDNYSPLHLVNDLHVILILALFASIVSFAVITRHTVPQV